MPPVSYDISIQPKDSKSAAERSQVESFIASLPGVRKESPDAGAGAHYRNRGGAEKSWIARRKSQKS